MHDATHPALVMRPSDRPTNVDPPEGYHTLTPRMVVADAAGAVQFLRAAFDATVEAPSGRPAEVRIGDSLVVITSAGEREWFPALLYVYVADADESYRRAVAAGATTVEAPQPAAITGRVGGALR